MRRAAAPDGPDALNAAFLNAVSANVLEYDDTHLGTVMHPAAPVAPGLFALAGLRPVSGRELLQAFILGVEISCRVGLGVMPTHYRRGCHITATCGIFSAAAACARLLRLDAQRTAWALGHAATQSASLVMTVGAFVLVEVAAGNPEALMSCSPSSPCTRIGRRPTDTAFGS